jgi:hypothetical protein
MQAGQESKARRGELFKRLPVGYVLNEVGSVVFHPDRRVYEALQLVFIKFRELWSVRQTFQWFRDHEVELPPIQSMERDSFGKSHHIAWFAMSYAIRSMRARMYGDVGR